MDSNPEVFEISSDEEGGWGEDNSDNLDWLTELLDTIDDDKAEDSDDVVVVSEVTYNSVINKQSCKPLDAVTSTIKDDLDDDCLILDGDPDNPVPVVNDTSGGSDDLLIVGEKGQLACRDYPHPRHLCAKFPFSSTPHEKCCDLCHCYVCDSLAPCIDWGTGVSNTDHCHSTDKDETWTRKRKYFKQGIAPPLLCNPIPTVSRMGPINNSYVPLHSISNSTPLRPCPSKTTFGMPNIISHRNNHRPGSNSGRPRYIHQVRRPLVMPETSNIIQRKRIEIGNSLPPQFVSPSVKFQRVGSASDIRMRRPRFGPYMSQPPLECHPEVPIENNHTMWQDFLTDVDSDLGTTFQSSSQPNPGSNFADFQPSTVSSQPNEFQHTYQRRSVTLNNATPPSSSEFDLSWMNSTTKGIVDPPQAKDPQLQNISPTIDLAPVEAYDPQYPAITAVGSPDFHLENWMMYSLEHQPVPGAVEDSVPTSVDPDLLSFDYETSWF